jgi:hypothetical protein
MTRPHRLAGPLVLVALGALAMPLCAQEQNPQAPQVGQPRKAALGKIEFVDPALSPPVVAGIAVEPPIRAVLRELNKPTDLRINKMPLIELADYLTKCYKIQFKLDRAALRRVGYSPRMEFSATAVGLPLKIALDRDLRPLGLQTRVVDGIVFITLNQPAERVPVPARPFQAKLLAALRGKTDIDVQIISLDKFAQFLTAKYNIPFQLDPNGLRQVDVHPSAPVSAQLEGMTLDQALRQILGRFRLTYRVAGNRILITNVVENREQPPPNNVERRGVPMRPVLRPGFGVPRRAQAARRPQLAVMLKPLIEAELLFMKKVCTPSKDELGQIRKGVENYLDTTNPGTVSTATSFVRESFDELVEKQFSRAKVDLYRAECDKRKLFERQACAHTLVAQLDRELCLSTAQREAISRSLAAKWDDSWDALVELVAVEGTRLVPQIPDDLIEPHLESPQLEIWINLPKVGSMNWRFQSPNLTIMGIPVPDWEDD